MLFSQGTRRLFGGFLIKDVPPEDDFIKFHTFPLGGMVGVGVGGGGAETQSILSCINKYSLLLLSFFAPICFFPSLSLPQSCNTLGLI